MARTTMTSLGSRITALPQEARIALAVRSALRVFPIIGQPSTTAGTGALTPADAAILQTRFRALSVAWAGGVGFPGNPAAVAFGRSIGTLATNAATSYAQRSAAQAVLAVTSTGETSFDAVVHAIDEAFSAEAAAAGDSQVAWTLDQDTEFLSGKDPSALASAPLWLNNPPDWAEQKWHDLRARLLNAGQNWQVWTIWYDDRLDGRIRSFEREMAYVEVSGALWRRKPATLNASIVKRIEEYEPPPLQTAPSDPLIDPGGARRPEFSDRKDLERWLAGKPPEWAVVIAARMFLRSIPALEAAEELKNLSVFRAASAAWVATNNPQWPNDASLSEGIASARINITGDRFPTLALASYAISAARSPSSGGPYRAARAAAAAVATAVAVAFSSDVAVANSNRVGAANNIWGALADDVRLLESGTLPLDLAHHPLWPSGTPNFASQSWRELKHELLLLNTDWEVWTTWLEERVIGGVPPRAHEIARVTIANEIWEQGPRAVNAEIARLTRSHQKNRFERQDHAAELSRPEYRITIENGQTIIITLSKYGGDPKDVINVLQHGIVPAEPASYDAERLFEDTTVVRVNPLIGPVEELAEKIAELIEREDIAKPESLKPPDAPLPPPSPAARFAYADGRFDITPTDAWSDLEAQAGAYHARAKILASGLAERLSRTDAVPDVAGSVNALVDMLGTSVADVQPDLLRLASRSIAAKARAYGHPAAQWEISVDSVGALFELADVLVDLQSFVKTDLEAHEQAVRELDLTPERAAEAKITLDIITDAILSAPEIISERAQAAFEAAAEVSETATDSDVKVAVEGERTLLAANLALCVARKLGQDEEPSDAAIAQMVTAGDQPAAAEAKPKKPQKRTNRAKPDDPTWQDFTDRIVKRIYKKGPDRIADATLDAMTGVIRHAPKTAPALGAALALWAYGSPVVAGGGALATTIAWICYDLLRKKNKNG